MNLRRITLRRFLFVMVLFCPFWAKMTVSAGKPMRDHTPQISFAYSRTVRSEENRPAEAVQISPRLA